MKYNLKTYNSNNNFNKNKLNQIYFQQNTILINHLHPPIDESIEIFKRIVRSFEIN